MSKSKLLRVGSIFLAAILLMITVVVVREIRLDNIQKESVALLEERAGEYDEGRIVLYDTTKERADFLAERFDAKLRITNNGEFATLTLPDGVSVLDICSDKSNRKYLDEFSADYMVTANEVDEIAERIHTTSRPNYQVSDTDYSKQTYLDYLNMKNVWSYAKGRNITVAVIDTGIDTDHPEFAGRISEYSYNATEDKIVKDYNDWSLIEDEQGHGTAVAGVVAASINGNGIVGIAPNVTILVIKAECDENGTFKRTSDLVFGLYYAVERDVNVVNMSFGVPLNNPFEKPLQLAVDSDIICVASAGNEAMSCPTYPAADPNCIAVGALDAGSWELASYSNYGDWVDVVAPGTVYTTAIGGEYKTANGTSLSAPCVSGIVSLYLSYYGKHTEYETVKEILYASSCDLGDPGPDYYFGYGAVDTSAMILEDVGTVTFDYLTDEIENTTQMFVRSHTLQNMPEPERDYSVFDGWYYDDQFTEEYDYYTDKFVNDITLYAHWVNEEDGIPYTYVELDDGTIEIRSYTGHRKYITVPDKIDGKTVSSIGEDAFSGQTKLMQINLPKHLAKIRDRAFYNCCNLTGITIPDTVTYIGEEAFFNNVRLSYVSIGTNSMLETVGAKCFGNCSKLSSFTVTANVKNLDGSAFAGTTRMTGFSVANGNAFFMANDGILLNKSGNTVVAYPASRKTDNGIIIPAGVNTIGSYAFAYTKQKTIDFSGTVSVGNYAFEYSSLEEVIIPDKVTDMGEGAFQYSAFLRDLHFGNGLTTIPEGAFERCGTSPSELTVSFEGTSTLRTIGGKAFFGANIKSITIPKSVVSIGESAFMITGLTSVTFESGSQLALIGGKAFFGANIISITIPKSVVSIGESAFMITGLTSVTFESGSRLTSIGEYAFSGNIGLTKFAFNDGLEVLGDYSFKGTGLTGEIWLPASLEVIGAGAFASCHALTSFDIDDGNVKYQDIDGVVYSKDGKTIVEYPSGNAATTYSVLDGTETVFDSAFYGSSDLSRVYLPNGLTYIQRYAFCDVSSLTAMSFPDSVYQISEYAFYGDYKMESAQFGDNPTIPRLSFGCFAGCGITSFTVPSSVSTIAQYAFAECGKLTSTTFAAGSKLESISAYMFEGCNSLQTIKFENGSKLTSIQAHGFEGMRNLRTVDFGDAKLTNIDNFAFKDCSSLASFVVPDGVKDIGRFAFYNCTSIGSVSIPASVEFIGRFAFLHTNECSVYFASETLPEELQENWDHGCGAYYLGVKEILQSGDWKYAKLTSGSIAIIEYLGSAAEIDMTSLDFGAPIINIGGKAFYMSGVEKIVLPDTLCIIQKDAFSHSALKSVTIPASVTFIGSGAFANTDITSLTFAKNSQLKTIEKSAFERTKSLKSVIVPASVETLGSRVFMDSGITSLTFENGSKLTEIPNEAFAYSKIESVVIPTGITVIGDNAFREIPSLRSVTLPTKNDLKIRSNAFYATGLTSLRIPANVSYIGEYAFIALDSLKAYEVDANNPYYKSVGGLLTDKSGRKLIAVPAGMTGSLTVPVSVETIGFGAFENSSLSSVTFDPASNILTFGYRAFYNADNLTVVTVPASVVSIDYYAFAMCDNLKKVTFADGSLLTGIYEGAFCNDKNLSDIVLPDSIIEISDFAFYGCSKLDKVPVSEASQLKGIYDYAMAYTGISGELTTPETLTAIGNYAFMGTKITSLKVPYTKYEELVIGIGAFENCNKLESVDLPFCGAAYEDKINWFGYIFGAGSYNANTTYVPESLKKITLLYGPKEIDGITFGNNINLVELHIAYGTETSGVYGFRGCSSLTSITIPDSVTSIGFEGCSSLTSITIPDSVTSIGDWAFYGCSSLTSITIPDSVTSIGASAFDGCSSLTSITIPDSVTSIGDWAFSYCSSLTSITIPDSVTSIGNSAFSGCSSLTSITIPEGVTSIGDHVFNDCSSLTSITIPDSVTSIGDGAFSYCSSLTSITIPDSVTSIGDGAFFGCSSLISITIPDSVTSIGDGAFSYCSSLTSITIPEGVTSIGADAFNYCSGLSIVKNNSNISLTIGSIDNGYLVYYAEIIIDKSGNKTYRDPSYEIIEKDDFWYKVKDGEYTLYLYTGSKDTVTLPTDINGSAYTIKNMRGAHNVIIPKGVTSIGDNAFDGCSSLTSITIPDSVTSIGNFAFRSCSRLTSIAIPEGVTSIGHYAFCYCIGLTRITIPKSVTSIGLSTFTGCIGLTSITIPDSVTSIYYSAFSGCSNLTSINIPDGVTSICNGAFSGCRSLTSINIPDSVTSIGDRAFQVCSSLTSINIPESVTSIGIEAFNGCSSLTGITIPDGVTSIDYYAFSGCSSLASITIPKSVTSIGVGAFQGCSSLVSITIHEKISSILPSAFEGCVNLDITIDNNNPYFLEKEGVVYNKNGTQILFVLPGRTGIITINDGITSIPQSAFSGQSYLSGINIPNSVTSIGDWAFYGCSSLTSITIPDSVTSISSYAFDDCSSLASITIPKSVTSIGASAFHGCSSLASITIPDGVTSIGDYAFEHCTSLTSITIPDSVTSIDYMAFYRCSSLTSITIPEGVTSIGIYAFYGCSSLISVTIPDSVTSIGSGAFSRCSSLTSITIPDSVTSIGGDAFYECSGLSIVKNNSNISLTIGSAGNGYLAYYADVIIDKNGNKSYRDPSSEIIEKDDFWYKVKDGEYTLYLYTGSKDTVTLPTDINGSAYTIQKMRGVRNVIIPKGVTNIGYNAFYGCSSLTSITIPEGVTSIGADAFMECSSLTSITIPDSVTSIGSGAFYGCSSLTSISIPDSVISVGSYILSGTKVYSDPANWVDGCLCVDGWLIKADQNVQMLDTSNFKGIVPNALYDDYLLKSVELNSNAPKRILSGCSNIETLIINGLPDLILGLFDLDGPPLTLKNIVLNYTDGHMNRDLFWNITGVTIYVNADKDDLKWDEFYPGWNNGNKVYYKGEWITAEFTDGEGNWVDTEYLKPSQIIRQPWCDDYSDDQYYYTFVGYDIDGDGIADSIPATSSRNISAVAAYDKVSICEVEGHSFGTPTYVWNGDKCTATRVCVHDASHKETETAVGKYVKDTDATTSSNEKGHYEATFTSGVFMKQSTAKNSVEVPDTMLEYVPGDLDGNSKVDTNDAIYLLYHAYFPTRYPVNQDCDFNGDGKVDQNDAIYLLYHAYFPTRYPLK